MCATIRYWIIPWRIAHNINIAATKMLRTRSPLLVALYTILHSPFSSEQSPGAASTILKHHSNNPFSGRYTFSSRGLVQNSGGVLTKVPVIALYTLTTHLEGPGMNQKKHFPPQSASWENAQQCRPGEETDKGSVSINWKTNCAPGWGSGQSKKNWTKCKNCWKSVWYDRSTNHLVPSSNIAGWGQQRAFFRATAMLVALRNRGQEFREGSSQFPRKRHVQTSIQSLFSCLNFEQYPSWYKC